MFVELKESGWTLIVSTQPTQEKYDANDKTKIWGAYGYDPKFDVVRAPMTMVTPKASDRPVHDRLRRHDRQGRQARDGAGRRRRGMVPFTVAK